MSVLLQTQGIHKNYGATRALSAVDLDVRKGTILALMGANGSGKSTLTAILAGAAAPTGGMMKFDAKDYAPKSPKEAQENGVVAVAQELSLVPSMSIAQNIWLGALRFLPRSKNSSIRKRQEEATLPLLEMFGGVTTQPLKPNTLVSTLSPDESQIVEILKAHARQPQLLILDEATSTLDRAQVERLFSLMREWAAAGTTMIFVSHRMEEVYSISDDVCAIRAGKVVLHEPATEVTKSSLVSAMTGVIESELDDGRPARTDASMKKVVVSLDSYRTGGTGDITLELHEGEILGFGGLQRQGQSALLRSIAGLTQATSGSFKLFGTDASFHSPVEAMSQGIYYVGGDRRELSLMERPIIENMLANAWRRLGTVLDIKKARAMADEFSEKLSLRMPGLNYPLSSLSGGNAQKVILARALLNEPRILILDDPTKGVDLTTKRSIYAILREQRERGCSILIYTSEDDELLELADRALVFHDGTVVTELHGDTFTKQELVSASLGGQKVLEDQ